MNKRNHFAAILSVLLGSATCAAFAADRSGTVEIDVPAETARLESGPGVDTAQSCIICHSADYIYMQPPLTKDQWRGEVLKMKNVFGAPLPESDVDTIVTYLMSQNGAP